MIKLSVRNRIMKVLCGQILGEEFDDTVTLEFLEEKLSMSPREMRTAIDVLTGLGFVEQIPIGDNRMEVGLTDTGRCYFESTSDERKEFIHKSILCPIVVAFLTTLAVNYLLPILAGLLTGWLSKP